MHDHAEVQSLEESLRCEELTPDAYRYGMFGGLTPNQRAGLARERRRASVVLPNVAAGA